MRKKLHLKGWSKQEIDHAEKVFKKAEENKHPHHRLLDKSMYWFALIAGLLGTVILSFIMVPILVAASSTWAHIISGFFGLLLGGLIVVFVKQLHWLENHHHIFLSVIIPVVGLFNFALIVNQVNKLNMLLGIPHLQSPGTIGLSYLAGFLVPYASFMLLRRSR
jgi:hypothetical protein